MGDHQKSADFRAFRALLDTDVSVPITHATSGPGAQNMYLVINLEAGRNLNYERLHTIYNKHANNILREAPETPHREVVLAASNIMDKAARIGVSPFTAGSLSGANTIFLDLKNMNAVYNGFMRLPDSASWKFTPNDETLLKRAIFIHENAHATLGLKEPGADFVTAVTMLRESPESRSALNTFADFRAISIQNPRSNDRYGIECHDAIRHALTLPPGQIARMTDEEMLGLAKYFDDMNAANNDKGPAGPEQKASAALNAEIQNLMDASSGNKLEITRTALKQSKEAFSPDSKEHQIIETMENSFNNLMQNHIAPKATPATPASPSTSPYVHIAL